MMKTAVVAKRVAPAEEQQPLDDAAQAPRCTLDGDHELEQHLARTCEKIRAEVQKIIPASQLEALVLGGGYGRGEGGVLKTEKGDRPYNDLDFHVFLRGHRILSERRFGVALRELGERLSPEAGLPVEFKVDSLARFRRSAPTMFSYDLVAGHRVLAGGHFPFAGCEHHLEADNIPLSEATRLLMNRCSGLLFARAKLEQEMFTSQSADFVARNLAKAQLAFGDVVLAAYGQYHWSCRKRHQRLRQLAPTGELPWADELCRHHAPGVAFKLHPRPANSSREILQTQHEEIAAFALKVWLWLESRRLGCEFRSARAYALHPVNKCPDTNPWRNLLVNAKIFGPRIFFQMRGRRHPREGILNALALLLWETAALDPESRDWLAGGLRRSANGGANPVEIYAEVWKKLN